jgi:uncharacterized protein involved in exopolysaccharide biosynthesis
VNPPYRTTSTEEVETRPGLRETSEESDDSEALHLDIDALCIHGARLLSRHRRFFVTFVFVGTLASLVIALVIPPWYESTLRLMPPEQSGSSTLALVTALTAKVDSMGVGSDLLGIKSSGALFVGILQSRSVADDLIRRFDLRKVYSLKYAADARKKLASRTDISEDRKSGIIGIKVTDRDPSRAAAMAQSYGDELNDLVSQLTTSSAHRERVFLDERLKAVKSDLDSAAVEFSLFASKNTAIDIPEQGKAMLQSGAQLQGELIAAQSELSAMEQIYSPNNVRIRSLTARIAELQRQVERIGGKNDGSADAPDLMYPSVRKLPLLGVTYSDLYRRVKIQEAVYEALTRQHELAKVEEAKEIPTVRVLDSADVPEKKSGPPRLMIVIFGTGLSFGMALSIVLLKEKWRRVEPDSFTKLFVSEFAQHMREALVKGRVALRITKTERDSE